MKKQEQTTIEEVAYHEAGHAIVRYVNKLYIGKISIIPTDSSKGYVVGHDKIIIADNSPSLHQRLHMEKIVIAALAGFIAQKRFDKHANPTCGGKDFDESYEHISTFTEDQEDIELYLKDLVFRTEQFINSPHIWNTIIDLSNELIKKEIITGKYAREFIKHSFEKNGGSLKPSYFLRSYYKPFPKKMKDKLDAMFEKYQ